jgi:hypothetical protein
MYGYKDLPNYCPNCGAKIKWIKKEDGVVADKKCVDWRVHYK